MQGFQILKPQERLIIKKIKEKQAKKKEIDTRELRKEDKTVLDIVRENDAMFQADIIEKTGFGKAKVTRIIDRLEGKGIVERKRRGMTNIVIMKKD